MSNDDLSPVPLSEFEMRDGDSSPPPLVATSTVVGQLFTCLSIDEETATGSEAFAAMTPRPYPTIHNEHASAADQAMMTSPDPEVTAGSALEFSTTTIMTPQSYPVIHHEYATATDQAMMASPAPAVRTGSAIEVATAITMTPRSYPVIHNEHATATHHAMMASPAPTLPDLKPTGTRPDSASEVATAMKSDPFRPLEHDADCNNLSPVTSGILGSMLNDIPPSASASAPSLSNLYQDFCPPKAAAEPTSRSPEGRTGYAQTRGALQHEANSKSYADAARANCAPAGGLPTPRGVPKRKYCSHEGCTSLVRKGGVCGRHGARRQTCRYDGCTNVSVRGGACWKHGATPKLCSHPGCTNYSQKKGVCIRHGAEIAQKKCGVEGCTNNALRGGICVRHGSKPRTCSFEGCTNNVRKGGFCIRHGTKPKKCNYEGCTNNASARGVCRKHK